MVSDHAVDLVRILCSLASSNIPEVESSGLLLLTELPHTELFLHALSRDTDEEMLHTIIETVISEYARLSKEAKACCIELLAGTITALRRVKPGALKHYAPAFLKFISEALLASGRRRRGWIR